MRPASNQMQQPDAVLRIQSVQLPHAVQERQLTIHVSHPDVDKLSYRTQDRRDRHFSQIPRRRCLEIAEVTAADGDGVDAGKAVLVGTGRARRGPGDARATEVLREEAVFAALGAGLLRREHGLRDGQVAVPVARVLEQG